MKSSDSNTSGNTSGGAGLATTGAGETGGGVGGAATGGGGFAGAEAQPASTSTAVARASRRMPSNLLSVWLRDTRGAIALPLTGRDGLT